MRASCFVKFTVGRSPNPLCALCWDSRPAICGLPALEILQRGGVQTLSVLWAGTVDGQGAGFPLWKVCSGAECKLSVLLQAGTMAGQGMGFPLWKVCSRAECKPSLCSSRQGQWPPSTTLLWEQKPSLAAMDHWAVRPALASACELVRQVGNSQANKLHPVP